MSRAWWRNGARTAAWWFVRRRARTGARAETGFGAWLAQDTQRARTYEDCELAWELAGELEDDAEIRSLVDEADDAAAGRHARRRRRVRLASWSAAASVLIAVAGAALFMRPDTETYMTAVGEQRWVVLPDRSVMSMNTDTSVRVTYGRSGRHIELARGEATFEVTHDPRRPFEVHAGEGVARALGTQFNVLSRGGDVRVAVLTGTVQVALSRSARGASAVAGQVLEAGQEVTYMDGALSGVRVADTVRIQAWHSRRIVFDNLTLGEALAEFNLYTPVPVRLGDPSLADVRVSGVFRIGELEALLKALQRMLPLRVERLPGGVVLHADGPAAGEVSPPPVRLPLTTAGAVARP